MYSSSSAGNGIFLSKRDKTYVDISLAWEPSPLTGDITTLRDTRAINNSIKNIIMTYPLEAPFEPELGSEVTTLLFDPADMGTAGLLSLEIERAIDANEPRVEVVEVVVIPNTTDQEVQNLEDKSYSAIDSRGNEYFGDSTFDANYSGRTESFGSSRNPVDPAKLMVFVGNSGLNTQ